MTFIIGSVTNASTYATPSSPGNQREMIGLGTIATQNASAISITGGTINGTPIGAVTASSANFTALSASSGIAASSGSITNTLSVRGVSATSAISASSADIGRMNSTAFYASGTSGISYSASVSSTGILVFTNGILTGYTT